MRIERRFTRPGQDAFQNITWTQRTSRISNPDGSVVFEAKDIRVGLFKNPALAEGAS